MSGKSELQKNKIIEPQAAALSEQDDATSSQLVEARLNAAALPGFPGPLPATLEQAYAIQSASIARWPGGVGGWKVGLLAPADQSRFHAERLAGPIFVPSIHTIEVGATRTMPIYVDGFAAVEAEFILEIGVDLQPSSMRYSDEELTDIVSAMYVGAEIASSPMALINKIGPPCIVSDFGNNAGLIIGAAVPDWQARPLNSLTVAVSIDDAVVGQATAAAIPGGPMQAFRFLVELCSTRGLALPRGTLISTGATTGIHEVTVASKSRLDFGDFGGFEVEFEAMQPQQSDR